MAETYCGKACAKCAQKEELNCPGCKTGPGRLGGECNLAKCVRDNGYETCDVCAAKERCGTWDCRELMADSLVENTKIKDPQMTAIANSNTVLSEWLSIYLVFSVLRVISSFLFSNTPIVSAIGYIVCGLILLKLASTENRYLCAGLCAIAVGALSAIEVFTASGNSDGASLIFSIFSEILSLVGKYNEFMAHAAVLCTVDNELSEKWTKLWKWHIGMFLAMFGIIVFSSLIFMILILIGLFVVFILEFVYLSRTSTALEGYINFYSETAQKHNNSQAMPNQRNNPGTMSDPGCLVFYPVNGGSIMFDPTVGAVAGSKGEIVEVSIPSEIDGVIVAVIGNSAFRSSSHLTSITIPNSVTTIGDDVFFSCYNLTEVTVPGSVTAIGNGAFSGCYKLKDIYYGGSEEQWNQLGKTANDINGAVIHYNDAT